MNIKYLLLAAISAGIITADQATKIQVHTQFRLHESISVIANYFNITYVQNRGAAFGMLAESHPAFRDIFFLSMPPIAMLIIFLILRGVPASDRWMTTALSMVFGGAIGNYIDRLRFGYVIDFLDFHFQDKYVWPAFNVADMAIVCGVGILLFLEFTKGKNKFAADR
jgi:signal peptidase II